VKITDEEKYKDCDRLKIVCTSDSCKREMVLDGPFKGTVSTLLLYPLLMKLGRECILESLDNWLGRRSVDEILCLKLLLQFSSHLNEMLHIIPI